MKLTKKEYQTILRALSMEFSALYDVRLSKECNNNQDLINRVDANLNEIRSIVAKIQKKINKE